MDRRDFVKRISGLCGGFCAIVPFVKTADKPHSKDSKTSFAGLIKELKEKQPAITHIELTHHQPATSFKGGSVVCYDDLGGQGKWTVEIFFKAYKSDNQDILGDYSEVYDMDKPVGIITNNNSRGLTRKKPAIKEGNMLYAMYGNEFYELTLGKKHNITSLSKNGV